MLLLFFWQRYSVEQISYTMSMPAFLVKKHLHKTIIRAGHTVDSLPNWK